MRPTPFLTTVLLCNTFVSIAVVCNPAMGARALHSGSVVVRPNGAVMVDGRQTATLKLPPKPRQIDVRRRKLAGRCLLHVRVTGGTDGRAAELLTGCAGATPVLFAGGTGPQGRDGEWTKTLSLQDKRVLLFETRPEVHHCVSHKPARMYLREFDFERNRFRSARATIFSQTLPRIVARRRPPQGRSTRTTLARPLTRPTFNRFRVVAASSARGHAPSAAMLPSTSSAQDGDLQSIWYPQDSAVDAQPFLLARRPKSPYALRGLLLALSRGRLRASSGRPSGTARLVLVTASGKHYRVFLPAGTPHKRRKRPLLYWVWLPKPARGDCITLFIEGSGKVAPHSKAPLGIAEVRFVTDLDLSPRPFDALFVDLVANDPHRWRAALSLLARHPDAVLSQIEHRMADIPVSLLPRYLKLLGRIPSSHAARLLGAAVLRLPEEDRLSALQDMVAMGPVAAEALVALLAPSPRDLRSQVVAGLGALGGPAAAQALFATLASPDSSLRGTARHTLNRLPPQQLCPALASQRRSVVSLSVRQRADILALLPRCCKAMPVQVHATTAALMGTAWPSAGEFELRYAMLRAAICLNPDRRLWLIRQALSAPEPPLRAVALQQLARPGIAPRHVHPLLVQALSDIDPAVRRAAAEAAHHARPAASPALSLALGRALESEKWPFVAQAMALAIAVHCSKAGIRSLGRTVQSRVPGPDRAALTALARCSARGYIETAMQIAEDPHRRADLRSTALEAISPAMARRHHASLVRLYAGLRLSIHTEGDLQVATTCAQVLARTGTPQAVRALIETLESDPQEALQTAAASALGHVCRQTAASALRRAAAGHAPSSLTARVAADSLSRCGFKGVAHRPGGRPRRMKQSR